MTKKPRKARLKLHQNNRYAGFDVVQIGLSYSRWRYDPYHILLTVSWAKFIGLVSLGYIIANTIFALIQHFPES